MTSEPTAPDEATGERPAFLSRARFAPVLQAMLAAFEAVLYGIVGLLLVTAAVFVLIGTIDVITDAITAGENAAEISLTLLDRVLLTLIVAELVYTLRFVIRTHEIVAEPFLFIGLIAVVRRILIVAGEFEQPASDEALTNLLLQLGVLGLLTLALAAAIYLVRRSAPKKE